MLDPTFLAQKHAAGLAYTDYLVTGTPQQHHDWQAVYDRVHLDDDQRRLVASFIRPMKLIGLSGIWCGDCVQQCPLIQRIAEANDRIDLRWLDRDEHMNLQEKITICGGKRVPVVLFMTEDFHLCSWFGDRTLSRYRAVAERQLGASCPLPGAPRPTEEWQADLRQWLDEFERIHLMLRLSPRLRQKHGD